MNLVKKVAIKKCQILEDHSFLSFWSQKLGLKYDLHLIWGNIFQKGPHPKTHPLKNNTWSKKTTKSDFWQISPEWCASWVHILGRPFWGSRVLICIFESHQYGIPSIQSIKDIYKVAVPNFPKMHIFSHVFSRKK